MSLPTEELTADLDFEGRIDWLLPNQEQLTNQHIHLNVIANQGLQRFALTLYLKPPQLEQLVQAIGLWQPNLAPRFELKPEAFQRVLPTLLASRDPFDWFKADSGTLLKLENYTYTGPGAVDD